MGKSASENNSTRAERLVKEINEKLARLATQGVIPSNALDESNRKDIETPEMRKKRRKALEKLRTFIE